MSAGCWPKSNPMSGEPMSAGSSRSARAAEPARAARPGLGRMVTGFATILTIVPVDRTVTASGPAATGDDRAGDAKRRKSNPPGQSPNGLMGIGLKVVAVTLDRKERTQRGWWLQEVIQQRSNDERLHAPSDPAGSIMTHGRCRGEAKGNYASPRSFLVRSNPEARGQCLRPCRWLRDGSSPRPSRRRENAEPCSASCRPRKRTGFPSRSRSWWGRCCSRSCSAPRRWFRSSSSTGCSLAGSSVMGPCKSPRSRRLRQDVGTRIIVRSIASAVLLALYLDHALAAAASACHPADAAPGQAAGPSYPGQLEPRSRHDRPAGGHHEHQFRRELS